MLSKTKLQYVKNLSQKKNREKEGVFLVEGWRNVEEASNALKEIETLLFTKEAKTNLRYSPVISAAQKMAKEIVEVTPKELGVIADTVTAQGIAAVVKKFSSDVEILLKQLFKKDRAFIIALDQISDPGNMGTIIRTGDWFGVQSIMVSKNCVELYNPKVVRSTMGSIFHVPFLDCSNSPECFSDTLAKFHTSGFSLYGAEVSGNVDIRTIVWPKKTVLIIGNESQGISAEISKILDQHIAIPKFGKAESLNAGIAAGVLLAHYSFQQQQ